MEHEFTQQVFYSDTDAYGVVWHGSYLRWLEMGRVYYCENLGLNLIDLKEQDIVLPVTNLNVRYKASAKLNDKIIVKTKVSKITPLSITFEQNIVNKETGALYIQALVDIVAINNSGKLYRRLPDILKTAFDKSINEELLCSV